MTIGMKVAVSVPDDVYADADRLAQRLNKSRSAIYSAAVEAFVRKHSDEAFIVQTNAVLAEIGEADDDERKVLRRAAKRFAERNEW